MKEPEQPRTVISIRTAMLLYALLAVIAFATLKRTPLYLALLIVFALALKTYLHYLRSRME
jgi:4-hydroxybenzoate polyprenyltransferase